MTRNFKHNFIGGRRVDPLGPESIEVRSPYDGSLVGTAPLAAQADIDLAVDVARKAFDEGPWPRMPVAERIAVIRKFTDLYEARSTEFARLVTAEMGAPAWFAAAIQALIRDQGQAYLTAAEHYPWEVKREGFPKGTSIWIREPVGVVAAIIPWNAPHQVALAKLFPALLAGCTVILKLAPETAIDGQYLGELFSEAGLPDGVLSILVAHREVSEYLVTHPGVDKIGFTGSTAAGSRIASLAGAQLKRVSLELGGKSAALVLDDADIGETVEALRYRSFPNNGQVCVAQTRILISRRRHDAFTSALVDNVTGMKIGNPADPQTFLGPVAAERQRQRVSDYIQSGLESGAELATGGLGMPEGINHGAFVKPTVFANVDNNSRIAQEEIFGPVVCVIPYDGVDEAVRLANESEYGLSGSVWTNDTDQGLAIARRIRSGGLTINNAASDLLSPFGGFKRSGVGREFGPEAINHYIEHKTVAV
ncbi:MULTISPECIES: aldehyde dehydrogenase [unclassified Mesorhizobium]|uniref:aldehyde dehydrogenase n=1 Tax=unclassified Mesorhizobium TaxID=325217 RepID=UPI0011288794|nr:MULTISPECIES: aldehyde dehydrogenase [unclassified Mesorhizobium]TPJ45995.1 aldehyde dehydrogenase [Mesorhizobium sp. B2-6-6]MCA0008484.1 aldehyde dehydrogenase [Mesorhizobium sp. B264B1B]MCA0021308.1 aldehyde dehydrogenase [Mesorhizobium sp. B264B1A]MCA0026319.1 aldehyde dehydrogenase [Mesorhizobium sp. B263B1A]MCA0056723.1 aldehyde dehydrogenase [Mesorhizobium sp. B261B1A]